MPGRPVDCDLQPRIRAIAKRVDSFLYRDGWWFRHRRGGGESVIVDLPQSADNPDADERHGLQTRLVEYFLLGARETGARRHRADRVVWNVFGQ